MPSTRSLPTLSPTTWKPTVGSALPLDAHYNAAVPKPSIRALIRWHRMFFGVYTRVAKEMALSPSYKHRLARNGSAAPNRSLLTTKLTDWTQNRTCMRSRSAVLRSAWEPSSQSALPIWWQRCARFPRLL
jgi:hypothetical protein